MTNDKIKILIYTLLLLVYLVVSFGFINEADKAVNCHDVRILISDSSDYRFLHSDELRAEMNSAYPNLLGYPVHEINTKKLEKFFRQNPYVKTSEAYADGDGTMNILLSQRNPMVRVINRKGQSYYIDFEGNILPTCDAYSAHILVANGYIPDQFDLHKANNLFRQKCSDEIRDLFKLSNFIVQDEFWNAQVEQVYLTRQGEFELVPRVGPHIIQLGTVENFKSKFRKLELLYTKGFNNIGWNQYQMINLRYENQIICTKN